MRRTAAPVPAAAKVVARVPGHAVLRTVYDEGIMTVHCECGAPALPPLPATTAAILRAEHLEIHVARRDTMLSGQPLEYAGKSIKNLIEDQLDEVYARLMQGEGVVAEQDPGYARGLAHALAIMNNPYEVRIEAAKAAAHDRWEDAENAGLHD